MEVIISENESKQDMVIKAFMHHTEKLVLY